MPSTPPRSAAISSRTVRAPSELLSSAFLAKNAGCGKSESWMDRDTPTTVAPSLRNAFVTYVPRPPFAPVMTKTLPSSFTGILLLFARRPGRTELGIQCQATASEERLARYVGGLIGCEERENG